MKKRLKRVQKFSELQVIVLTVFVFFSVANLAATLADNNDSEVYRVEKAKPVPTNTWKLQYIEQKVYRERFEQNFNVMKRKVDVQAEQIKLLKIRERNIVDKYEGIIKN